ncbi:MAG: hypothetical protein H7Z13_19065 [Ferruginibacter sp.]|nr:hypothetical protein [Ferruginibacter sp.]
MNRAGAMSRRVQAYCKKNNTPFVHYNTGERKHEDAEKLLPNDASYEGIFAIFCSRTPGLLWEVHEFGKGKIAIQRKKKPGVLSRHGWKIRRRDGRDCTDQYTHCAPDGKSIVIDDIPKSVWLQ